MAAYITVLNCVYVLSCVADVCVFYYMYCPVWQMMLIVVCSICLQIVIKNIIIIIPIECTSSVNSIANLNFNSRVISHEKADTCFSSRMSVNVQTLTFDLLQCVDNVSMTFEGYRDAFHRLSEGYTILLSVLKST